MIWATLLVRIISKKTVRKIILYFSECTNISKKISNANNISEWKSKGLSDEVIEPPDNGLAPTPVYDSKRMYLIFNGGCLKQDEIIYHHDKIVNIYIVYDFQSNLNYNPDFTLESCLFGVVKVTKNVDVNKYKYFGYCIGLDRKGVF